MVPILLSPTFPSPGFPRGPKQGPLPGAAPRAGHRGQGPTADAEELLGTRGAGRNGGNLDEVEELVFVYVVFCYSLMLELLVY